MEEKPETECLRLLNSEVVPTSLKSRPLEMKYQACVSAHGVRAFLSALKWEGCVCRYSRGSETND